VPARVVDALATTGMLALCFPEEVGGAGAGLFETGLLFFEGGRALCPSVVYSTVLSGIAIQRLGGEAGSRWLPLIGSGTTVAAALWSPEDARALLPAVRLTRSGGRAAVTGEARFVENAVRADRLLLTCRDADDAWVLAMLTTDGPTVDHQPVGLLGRDPVGHVTLRDHPAEIVATVDDAGLGTLADIAVALQCMEMAGGTERVIADAVTYVGRREQFGRPIGSFQAVQHIIADLRIASDAARLAAWHAMWQVSVGRPAAREAAIAKVWCSDAYKSATLQSHQLTGGMGFLRESDLHLWSERAKVCEIRNGAAGVALDWLAAELDAR
jgi:alkylation response protein AidB-like acyl-CoA dehydrogenase